MAITTYIPPHLFDYSHRFDYVEPAHSFFNPDREQLAFCTRALHARTGDELKCGAGKTTAIAHMINWEIQDGLPNKKHVIITNERSTAKHLFDRIINLHQHYTIEGMTLPTLTVSSSANVVITTSKQQQFMFCTFDGPVQVITSERFHKAWLDIHFNVRWDTPDNHRIFHDPFDLDEEAICYHIQDIFRHFDEHNTKVYV